MVSVLKEKINPDKHKPFQPVMRVEAGKERLTEAKAGR